RRVGRVGTPDTSSLPTSASPRGPLGVKGTWCPSCPPPLPPQGPAGGHPNALRAALVQGLLVDGPPLRCAARFARLARGLSLVGDFVCGLARRVAETPRRHAQGHRRQGGPRGTGHALPARHL